MTDLEWPPQDYGWRHRADLLAYSHRREELVDELRDWLDERGLEVGHDPERITNRELAAMIIVAEGHGIRK